MTPDIQDYKDGVAVLLVLGIGFFIVAIGLLGGIVAALLSGSVICFFLAHQGMKRIEEKKEQL